MIDEKPEDEGPPPPTWWLTAYARSIHDFQWLSSPEIEGKFFRNLDTISAFALQRKELNKTMEIFMVLSFIGAALIVAGGLPRDSQISVFGIEGPADMVTVQLLAAVVAGLFSRFVAGFGSLMLLNGMLEKSLEPLKAAGPEFVLARYDATLLWANLLRRREVGYRSPKPHLIAGLGINVVGLLWLLLHFTVVLVAMWFALDSAWSNSGFWSFSFFIALSAGLMCLVSVLTFVLGFFIPLPYRASEEVLALWEKKRAEAGPAAIVGESKAATE